MLMTRVDEWYGAPEKERAGRERERESERARGNGQGRGRKRGKKELDGQPAKIRVRVRVRGHVTEQRDLSLCLLTTYPQARSWPDEVMSPPWPASAMPPRPPASSWIFKEFNSILVEYCKRGCVSQEFD